MHAPWRSWLWRHLRRWGPHWVVGLALLFASELLWLWQSWGVRTLLDPLDRSGP